MSPRTVVIDFETYYDKEYHLRKKGMTYPEFILDSRFKVHGLAVDYGDGQQQWVDGPEVADFLPTLKDDILVAHNGFFDFGILHWHYGFRPAYMVDTLLIANHVLGSSRDLGGSSNDLGSLALRLGLKPKGDAIVDVKGIRDLSPGQRAALVEYALHDVSLARQVLNKLLPRFSNADSEFWLMDHTFRIYLERPLKLNPEKLKDVRQKVETRRRELVESAGVPVTVLSSDKQFAAHFSALLKAKDMKMPMKRANKRKDGSQPMIPALSKSDPSFIKLTEHPDPEIANLVKARLAVRSAAAVTARLATMQKYLDLGIGIPVHLVYYGAHTGRFAGGGGFNFQNLTSPDRAQDEIERLIAQAVRDAIEAGDGRTFVAVDAAQIEARVNFWMAGQEDALEDFANGVDIYSKFISEVIGEEVRKPLKTDDPKTAAWMLLMRSVGKEAVLGLGFSMGVDKFFTQLPKKSREIAKKIDEGEITLEFAADVVRAYREKYTKVVEYWAKLEKAFHAARQGATRKVGPVTFKRLGFRAVEMVLPSGRSIYYRNIRSERYDGKKSFTGVKGKAVGAKQFRLEWKHGSGQRIYGGLLAENIAQAIARDILVEQGIIASEQAGYPVNISVHDEVVANVEESRGQEAHDFLVKSLSTAPAWAPGLVLAAEGRVTPSLSK